MGIALVPDIEDETVVGRIENLVNGNGQFDHAKACAEMTAGDRDGIDELGAQFIGQLPQVPIVDTLQIRRKTHAIQKRRFGSVTQVSRFHCWLLRRKRREFSTYCSLELLQGPFKGKARAKMWKVTN